MQTQCLGVSGEALKLCVHVGVGVCCGQQAFPVLLVIAAVERGLLPVWGTNSTGAAFVIHLQTLVNRGLNPEVLDLRRKKDKLAELTHLSEGVY